MSLKKQNENLNTSSYNDSSDNDSSDNDSSDNDSSDNEINTSEPTNELDDTLVDSNIITIFGEQAGKRSNTYVVGLNIDDTLRKEYVKTLKKKHGCNGSIKKIKYDDIEQIVIQLQGNQITKVHTFLKEIGVKQKIIVKPF